MEHTSELVATGKFIHETTYPQRPGRYTELAIDGIKIDFYDANRRIVHEIKKSNKLEKAHVWQLKYYLFILEKNGINGVTGVLEYPLLRQTEDVLLTQEDIAIISDMESEIERIINSIDCPPLLLSSRVCKNCSYVDFCYSGEEL